jgi:hypothetical protein
MEGFIMGKRDQMVLEVVCKVSSGKMRREEATRLLDISERTLRRYLSDYSDKGIAFIRHGNKGRFPINKIPDTLKRDVQSFMKEQFFDFNMCHALEKIREQTGANLKYSTFRTWCHEIGQVKLAHHKRRSRPRFRRERMSQSGVMVQMDGSPHCWFGEMHSCLVAAIDDASSEIVGGEFFESESTFACMKVLKDIVSKKGVMQVLYVDKAGIYGGIKRQGFSQVARAIEEIGSHIIFAHSPEAKGRIERLFKTLQDRLIPEMRINKIRTMVQANDYIRDVYIPHQHNPRFSVQPHNTVPAWRALAPHLKLDEVFCVKEYRVAARDHTISFQAEDYMIAEPLKYSIHKQRIEIRIQSDGSWKAYFAGKILCLTKIQKIKKAAA